MRVDAYFLPQVLILIKALVRSLASPDIGGIDLLRSSDVKSVYLIHTIDDMLDRDVNVDKFFRLLNFEEPNRKLPFFLNISKFEPAKRQTVKLTFYNHCGRKEHRFQFQCFLVPSNFTAALALFGCNVATGNDSMLFIYEEGQWDNLERAYDFAEAEMFGYQRPRICACEKMARDFKRSVSEEIQVNPIVLIFVFVLVVAAFAFLYFCFKSE